MKRKEINYNLKKPVSRRRGTGLVIDTERKDDGTWTGKVLRGAVNVPIQTGKNEKEVLDKIHDYINKRDDAAN